jgi:sugar lactone lactonase YvrE
VAGGGESGYVDGPAKAARFQDAMGLAVDARGTIYVADDGNRRIRTITPDGIVSTFAGSGKSGGADGPAGQATFADPSGVAVDRDGIVYVLDFVGDHPRVRKIGLDRRVTTIARTE